MGITRDSQHKRRLTGGKKPTHHMKRKHEMGRQMAMTKIGAKRIRDVRVRGGSIKHRALRADTGNFSWGSEVCTRKTRILDVVYNASNNELVRTKTLVKNAIVQIDATPFRQWYEAHYGVSVGRKKKKVEEGAEPEAPKKQSKSVLAKISKRQETRVIDANINSQFDTGRLLACVSSRPGQCGRVDGYVLEGKELEFYVKKMARKKK
jgi:small subunit ribosomal protein S8e